MQRIVTKFGGSSLADAAQIRKVMQILQSDARRVACVPSAPGKRSADDIKITDRLYHCQEEAAKGAGKEAFAPVRQRFLEIAKELSLSGQIENALNEVEKAICGGASSDYAASRGEYLNGLIMAEALGWAFIDAAEVIFFDEKGVFDAEKTQAVLSARISALSGPFVLPGFYGSLPDGSVKTFSRGGSDISGSIVARAAGACLYENWTDVSGFLVADPRIVENPCPIRTVTYRELRELSYMGASVLHEDSIFPVRTAGIPIQIRNTNEPKDRGTMIVPEVPGEREGVVTGIAGKKGFTVITLEKDRMNTECGFGRKVLSALEENGISFEHLPTGIDTMGVVLSDKEVGGKLSKVMADIEAQAKPDHICADNHMALIAVVGRGMVRTVGTASRAFAALSQKGINIRLIDQGSSELNIIIGVDEADFEESLRALYREFFQD